MRGQRDSALAVNKAAVTDGPFDVLFHLAPEGGADIDNRPILFIYQQPI